MVKFYESFQSASRRGGSRDFISYCQEENEEESDSGTEKGEIFQTVKLKANRMLSKKYIFLFSDAANSLKSSNPVASQQGIIEIGIDQASGSQIGLFQKRYQKSLYSKI